MENWKRYLAESNVSSWAANPILPKEVRVYHYSSGKYCAPCSALKAGMTEAGWGAPSYIYYDMDPFKYAPQLGSFESALAQAGELPSGEFNVCIVYNPKGSKIVPDEMGAEAKIELNAFRIPVDEAYDAQNLIIYMN